MTLTFKCSTQFEMKSIMLINVKLPTIVGILKLISIIITTYDSLKARKVIIFSIQLKIHAQLSMRTVS